MKGEIKIPQIETYFVKETNGYFFIPGVSKLTELDGTAAYAKARLNTDFYNATLNYSDCAFNMLTVSVKDSTYRINLHFHPELFISRIDSKSNYIMARKNPENVKPTIFTVIRENGIIRLKADNGEWVCTNSKGYVYCSSNEEESMHIVPVYTTY